MTKVVISGSGLFAPPVSISNEELVASFNAYVEHYNHQHQAEIAQGSVEALQLSATEFIEKASGIKQRYVLNKSGILDTQVMCPTLRERSNDQISHQAEMGVKAAEQALFQAGRSAKDVDLLVVACSNLQRAYPAVSVEIQAALGCRGYAYDMNVACSSATFGIKNASDAIAQGSASCALVISPEICTAHLDFRDRDCHFIFGDAATALVLESDQRVKNKHGFEIYSSSFKTQFSNNIRNNFGFLNRTHGSVELQRDKLFKQAGRKVYKEVVPMVSQLILEHLSSEGLDVSQIKRLWLHQANLNMNTSVAKKVLGREALSEEMPTVLDEYGNTSSAGCVIAFHKYHSDLASGDFGLMCSFGAGYSVGSLIVRKI